MPRTLLLLIAATSLTACGPLHRSAVIKERTEHHHYAQSLDALWPSVRAFLDEYRFEYEEVPEQHLFVTDWRDELDGAAYTQYVIQGERLGATESRITIRRMSRQVGDGKPYWKLTKRPERFSKTTLGYTFYERALDLEWELLRRLDPEGAKAIEVAASR